MNMLPHCHITHLISSKELYGAERWVLALLRAAKEYRVKFSLINLTNNRSIKSDIVEIAKKGNIVAFDFYTGTRFNPIAGIRLAQWAKTNNVDIFHSHGYKADTLGLIAAKLSKRKIITTTHGWSLERDFKEYLYEKWSRFLMIFMDYVCPLSEDLFLNLSRSSLIRKKLKLILNGVDIEEIDSISSNIIKPQSEEFHIGYIGQLIRRKNIPIVFEALKHLVFKGHKVKLILVGAGNQRSVLEREVSLMGLNAHVSFYGNRKDVISILKSLDLLILPSLSEGIPRCVMEAMTAKVPVIASDIPGNRDLIINGETGLLFKPDRAQELVTKIEYIMENPDTVKDMVAKAREKVENEYSNHRMASEYIQLYHLLLSAY